MKKITVMLLSAALLAISSCSKNNDSAPSNYQGAPSYFVPYWANNIQLSANGGSDKISLKTIVQPVISGGAVVWVNTSTHILYNEHDYVVTNVDSGSNAPIDPVRYGGHKIVINGNGQRLTGTYTMSTYYVTGNVRAASFILTINTSGVSTEFANNMYVGQSGTVPNF